MEAHGNIQAAAATEHGSESQLIELLSEDAGQTDEYELWASWWARLSTGASREAPVDNECLGKCRQV